MRYPMRVFDQLNSNCLMKQATFKRKVLFKRNSTLQQGCKDDAGAGWGFKITKMIPFPNHFSKFWWCRRIIQRCQYQRKFWMNSDPVILMIPIPAPMPVHIFCPNPDPESRNPASNGIYLSAFGFGRQMERTVRVITNVSFRHRRHADDCKRDADHDHHQRESA